MVAPTNMLVASDLSEQSASALKRAAQLAQDLGAHIELLHVIEESVIDFLFAKKKDAFPRGELVEAATKQLQDHAGKEIPPGVTYRCRVETGKPFLTIIRTARRLEAGLIVVAAHGRHSLEDLFIGTTAEKVVRKGGMPVLVVKTVPRTPYRRLLVPTDFSPASRQALSTALSLAPDAAVDLLHVYTLWGDGYLTTSAVRDRELDRYHNEMRSRASEAMTDWLGDVDVKDRRIRHHVRHGRPGTLVPKVAKELAADLVAMGTTGSSGLSSVLLGSVAEHALWRVPCDLLTVRPAGFRFEPP